MLRNIFLFVTCVILAVPSVGAEPDRAVALDRLFAALHRTDDLNEANRLTTQIWNIWHHPDGAENLRLMDEGRAALQRLDIGNALDRFNRLIVRAPDVAEGWNKRATLYYMIGDYQASIRDIAQVLALEPRHFGALAGLGMNYDSLGDKRRALKAWRRALDAHPHLGEAPIRIRQLEAELQERRI